MRNVLKFMGTSEQAVRWFGFAVSNPRVARHDLHPCKEGIGHNEIDHDRSIRQIIGVGPDCHYELISKKDWVGRRLIAYRCDRRAFPAGDAAHLWGPMQAMA